MERGNTTHGPRRDDELAHESAGVTHGAPQRAHIEEWRESEPLDEAEPAVVRPEGTQPRPSGRDIELRSELARTLTRASFPADPATLSGQLDDAGASADLVGRVAQLPSRRRFGSVHELLVALGINAPEQSGHE
jgi:hypothetical protein